MVPVSIEVEVFANKREALNMLEVRNILVDDVGLNAVKSMNYLVTWNDGKFYVYW